MKKIINWICIFIIYFFSSPIVAYSEIDRLALPQGGNVVSGNVNINYAALDRLNVNQTSNQAIVNWQSFNVGRDASVHFNQPGSKASILNNVLSGRSIINGSIYSNGRLFLVNPTGILTGPHSAIKAEGAVLSTLNLSKQNYLNNNYQFNTNSNSSLVNQGLIEGQYVALIAPQVNNKGTIITSAATTIAAGDDVLLGISDSNNLTVKVSPSKLQAMAKNEGTIKTQNGIVTIKTDAAQSLVDEVVKLPNAKADGLVSENGVIKLVSNSGSIKAKKIKIDAGSKGAAEISGNLNSNNENGKGGTIEITAKEIDVNAAKISADGKTGGGKVLIGGDWQGSGELLQATYVNVDDATFISANATASGGGGKIVLWSDIKNTNSITTVNGSLFAKGIDGEGGKIETSGSVINTDRIIVNASSKLSRGGLWLIDPYDYTIDSTAVSNITSALNSGTSVTVATSADNSSYGSGGSSSGNGDITITSNLQTTAGSSTSATLTLTAARHITLNSGVSITDINSHSLSVAMNAGGDITLQGDIDVAGTVALTTTSYSGGSGGSPTTVNFSYTGAAVSWTVPSGVSSLTIDAKGAGGGYGYSDPTYPGKGGRLQATFSATAGESLRIRVGGRGENSTQNPGGGAAGKYVKGSAQGGFNGGGNASGTHYSAGGGGGATDIRRGGDNLSNRIAVAGGGGGQGAQRRGSAGGGGNGHGGGTTGASGSNGGYNHATGGGGGTQSAGGARGTGNQNHGTAGSLGQGGAGGGSGREGGGGGGGYYGGGGGGSSPSGGGGGGGGGSNYILSGATSVTHTRGGGATYNAHGSLSITYTASSTEYGDIVINGDLKAGAGIASNSNRGSTVSTEGDLTISGDASIKDGITADSITNNGIMRWTVNAGNLTTSHQISGTGKLFKYGSSNLTLSNSQSYTGDTEVYSGTLINNSTLSDSTDLILTEGNYTANATDTVASISTSNSSSTLTIASGQTLTASSSSNTTFAGIIQSSGNFTKAGSGTLTLTGANTYTGNTTISAGTLKFTGSGQLGSGTYSGTIANSGTLHFGSTVSGGQNFSGVISGSGNITQTGSGILRLRANNTFSGNLSVANNARMVIEGRLGSGTYAGNISNTSSNSLGFIFNTSDTQTVSGVLSGSGNYSLYDTDVSGELTLTGNNTFSSALKQYGGSLIIGHNNALGSSPSITLFGTSTKRIGLTNSAVSPSLTLTGNGGSRTLALSSNFEVGSLTNSDGNVTLNMVSARSLTVGSANSDTTFAGILSGTGKLYKSGSGTLTLSGTNTYTGGTDITAGGILITNDRNLGAVPGSADADNVIIRNGATLATGNANVSMAANRGFNVPSGTAKLLKYTRKSWTLNNPISGSGGVNFDDSTASGGNGGGGGRYYLKVANTYTGDTLISFRGTRDPGVVVDHNNAFQNTTVDYNNTNIPNANETSEPLLWFRTTAPVLGGLKGDRDLINEQSFTANAVLNIGNNNEDTTFSGRIRDGQRTYGIKKIGTGSLTLTGSNSYSGGTTLAGGSISGYSGDLTLAPTSAITLTSNLSSPSLSGSANINLSSYTLTVGSDDSSTSYTGVISGTGALIKQGSGTLTLTGTQTYTGNTTISAGTLTVSGSGSLNSGNYAGAIVNSGTLNYASSTSQTLSGVISGTGSVTKSGSSTLTLSGNNTYSGDTTISAGTINVSGRIGNGSYSGAIANSGTLIMSSSTAHTLSGAISGSGGITKSGSGNLTLSGSNNFTGTITLSNGTLIGASDNALGSAPTIAASNSPTFQTSSSSITLPSLTVTGEINLTSDIITTGAQSYSAATTIGASSGSAITVRTTNSNITFSDDVKLYQNTTINSGSGGGSISFGGDLYTHNSASAERNLIVNAGTGDVTFSGSITGGGDYSAGFTQGSFTNESDLDFSGTFLNAINIAGNAVTVGDAAFQRGHAGYNTSNSNESFQNQITSWNATTWSSSGLTELMRGIRWSGGTSHSPYVQFTNATAGKKYKIQALFKERCCNRYFDVYVDGTKIVDDFKPQLSGGNSGSTGRYLTYQFEASSSNVMFRMSGRTSENSGSRLHSNDVNPILNAISIEEVNAGKKINNLTVSGAAVSAAGIEVAGDMSITNSGTSSVTGVVAGSGDFTKAGSGMLSLTGTNTYSGDTTVSAGTLRLSGSGTLGSGSYSGAITNNGIFRYSSSSAQTLSGVISGTGRVDANSSSTSLTLTGTNTYTGGTRIAGGSIVAGSARALGAKPTINATSTSSQLSVSSGLTLPSLTVTGSAIRLNSAIKTTGAQSYGGDVLVAAGTRASPVKFSTSNKDISFTKTLKGQGNAKARSLTIDAGTGNVLFGDRVGYAFNTETFDANNTADSFYKMTVTAGTTTIKGDIMTYEEQTYNSNINIGSTGSNGLTRTLLSMDPKVIINGNVNDTVANRHTLVAKAIAVRRDGQTPGTPDVTYNGTIGQTKKLAGYSGATGYQVASKRYGTIDTQTSFGSVTGGTQRNGPIGGGSGSSNGSQSNKRKAQKSANAVVKNAKTTIADAGRNLIATLFGGGPSGGGRTFSKSIEVVMPGDAGFNQPGPQTGSGANIDADFSSPGNNQPSPSFEPRGNNSIGGAPTTNTKGGNFSSLGQGSGSSKPRSIKELFSSRDFKNQFGSRQEMRQFKREFRQQLRQNPGSRKSFNKALRQGMDPMDPKSFENATPQQRKAFDEFRKRATPEEQKAFRKFKDGEKDLRRSSDKSKEKIDRKSKDNKKLEDDDDKKKKDGNAKAN